MTELLHMTGITIVGLATMAIAIALELAILRWLFYLVVKALDARRMAEAEMPDALRRQGGI